MQMKADLKYIYFVRLFPNKAKGVSEIGKTERLINYFYLLKA